jgi:SAM-dependent methyltransferase
MDRSPDAPESEADAVRARYARRAPLDWRYHRLNPAALLAAQERERAVARLFVARGWRDLRERRLLEVGCGSGDNLLEMLRLGFAPEHLAGIELLDARHAAARSRLPGAIALTHGDALHADIGEQSQDVVLQSTVFSSLLDDAYRQRLAERMWRWVSPGGALLWYDFTVDNPRNADVRGVPLSRVRALFPQGCITARRVTLAPPLARAAVRLHPALYTALNVLPPLRTHLLAWIEKPEA